MPDKPKDALPRKPASPQPTPTTPLRRDGIPLRLRGLTPQVRAVWYMAMAKPSDWPYLHDTTLECYAECGAIPHGDEEVKAISAKAVGRLYQQVFADYMDELGFLGWRSWSYDTE